LSLSATEIGYGQRAALVTLSMQMRTVPRPQLQGCKDGRLLRRKRVVTKTKANVFVTIPNSVQKRVHTERVYGDLISLEMEPVLVGNLLTWAGESHCLQAGLSVSV